jgi:Tol biopolymer transport system component
MDDLRTLVRDEMERAGSPSYSFDDLARGRDRKRRNKRITAGVVGLATSLLALGVVVWAFAGQDGTRPAGADRGTFVFIGGSELRPHNRLYSMSANGSDLRVIPTGDLYLFAAAPSPDGERIALMASEPWPKGDLPRPQLFLMGADGSALVKVPACPEDGCQGVIVVSWSPDGRFLSFPGNGAGIHVLDTRTGASRKLTAGSNDYDAVWSPDGRWIAFSRTEPSVDPEPNAQIWVMNADGTAAHQITDPSFANEATQPAWSPDGATIAYTQGGHPGGTAGVAVIDVDGSNARQLTACTFGSCERFPTNPVWSPDGTAIALLWQEARLTQTAIALVDPESGGLRIVRELPFSASSLTWQVGTAKT